MIKNFNEMTNEEISAFSTAYEQYFKTDCISHKKAVPRRVEEWWRRLNSGVYADEMIARISSGERIAFADFGIGDSVNAFITGKVEDDLSSILHFYVKDGIEPYRKRVGLELYKSLVDEFQRLGAKSVVEEADIEDYKLVDMFEALGLDEQERTDHEVEYGKHI